MYDLGLNEMQLSVQEMDPEARPPRRTKTLLYLNDLEADLEAMPSPLSQVSPCYIINRIVGSHLRALT